MPRLTAVPTLWRTEVVRCCAVVSEDFSFLRTSAVCRFGSTDDEIVSTMQAMCRIWFCAGSTITCGGSLPASSRWTMFNKRRRTAIAVRCQHPVMGRKAGTAVLGSEKCSTSRILRCGRKKASCRGVGNARRASRLLPGCPRRQPSLRQVSARAPVDGRVPGLRAPTALATHSAA